MSLNKEWHEDSIGGEYSDTDLFLDKVITREVLVPEPNSEARYETFNKVLTNILLSYGVKVDEIELYEELLDATINITANIRKMILIINNSFAETFTKDGHDLFLRDLLAMNIVKKLNSKLWKEIRDNKRYFITFNLGTRKDSGYIDSAKSFFEKFLLKYQLYAPLLNIVFPVINDYANNRISTNYTKSYPNEKKVHLYKSITSGVYFEDYFVFGYSRADDVNQRVRGLVYVVNEKSLNDIEQYIIDVFNESPKYIESFYIMLEFFIDDLRLEKLIYLTKILIKHYYEFKDSNLFLNLSTRSRAEIIIGRLISTMKVTDIDTVSSSLASDPIYLGVIDSVLYWLKVFERDGNFNYEMSKNLSYAINSFTQLQNCWCNEILDQNINLYDAKYFHIGNIYALFRYYQPDQSINEPDKVELAKYMKNCLNAETVFRVLSDIVHKTTHYGDKITFRYSFNKSDFQDYLVDPNVITSILNTRKPFTKSEKFLNDLFELYLKYESIEDEVEKKNFKNYIELDNEFKFKFE